MQRKILFILGKDVHNKGTYRIYKECMRRGFDADVYATTFADNHIALFLKENINIQLADVLDKEKLEKYDYIFSAVPLFDRELFREAEKYIFLNPSTHLDEVYFSGDFIFTARDLTKPLVGEKYWPIEEFNYQKSLPAMAAGGAALEKLENTGAESNVILFIDAGHFPFGTKKKLAEYVIQIANDCPDYEIRIKPRYLPTDTNTTHINRENLFHYLLDNPNLPRNLKLIREHTDLAEEVKEACLVICPEGTTSYEEVILAGKNLIIFTDFPNGECVLWPERRVRLFNSIPDGLVNRIYYKDIASYLPKGLPTKAADLKSSLYKITNVASDIVDAMEYIFEKFICQQKFPANRYYTSSDYLQKMEPDVLLTWNDIKCRRYKTILYDMAAQKIRYIYKQMDCGKVLHYIEEIGNELDGSNLAENIDKLNEVVYDLFIQNKYDMMDTAYTQSILCLAYYKKNRLSEFTPSVLRCKAYYEYCLAKIDFDNAKYVECLKHLEIYFEEVNSNLYEISYADDEGVKVMAHYYMGAALFWMNDWDGAKNHLYICDKAWEGRHKKAAEYLQRIESMCNKRQSI